jgi:hypothetical protein
VAGRGAAGMCRCAGIGAARAHRARRSLGRRRRPPERAPGSECAGARTRDAGRTGRARR